jgi:hypothetical protein
MVPTNDNGRVAAAVEVVQEAEVHGQDERPRSSFLSAGLASSIFVGLVDQDRQLVRRLSGDCSTIAEARRRLAWLRHRHPDAAVVRDILVREILP